MFEPIAIVRATRTTAEDDFWGIHDYPHRVVAALGRRVPARARALLALGTTFCRLLSVSGSALIVAELDAIDGTPVFDRKPVMREFLPRGEVHQPHWATELMANYWKTR